MVSSCARRKKKLDQLGTGRRREMAAYAFFRTFEDECVATEDGCHEHLELHVCEVLTHARPIIHAEHKVSFPTNGTSVLMFQTLGRTRTG